MSSNSGASSTPSAPFCGEADHATWQGVLVVKPNPVFDPITWFDEGGIDSAALQGYAKTHVVTGVSVPLALLALVLLFSLLFVGWRCLRCCCCSSTYIHVHPSRELKSPWLCAHQAFVALFSFSAIAFCVLGIVKLPKHVASGLEDRVQFSLSYADSIVDQLAILQQATLPALNSSLQPVQDILDNDVNAPVVLAQLQVVEPFLDGLPAPKPLYDALSSIHHIVDQQLTPALNALEVLLNTTADKLLPSVSELAYTPSILNTIQDMLQQLNETITALPDSYNSTAQPDVDKLKAVMGVLHLDTWVADLQAIGPDMDVLDAARNTSLLPSVVSILNVLLQYRSTALASLQVLLPGLNTLDNLQPDSLLGVLPDLIARMEHLNTTILQFDNRTSQAIDLMRTAVHVIQQLYPMEGANSTNMTAVSRDIATISGPDATVGRRLDLTTSLSDWITQLQQLNSTVVNASGWEDLKMQVGQPQQLLQQLPPTQPVRTAITAFTSLLAVMQGPMSQLQVFLQGYTPDGPQAEGSYAALMTAVNGVKGPITTASDFLTAATTNSVAQLYLQSSQAINDTLAPMAGNVSMGLQLLRQVRQEVRKLPDLSGPLDMLNATLDLWNQLPTPHSLVLSGPRQLLTGTVDDCRKSLQEVRDQLQSAQDKVNTQVSNLQSQYLPDIKAHVWDMFGTVDQYWSYAHKGLLAGYSSLIGCAVLLTLVTLLRCPCGLVASLILQLLLSLLWLVVGLVAMAGLVVLQDGCTYAEPLIIGQVSHTDTGLLLGQHYLYGQGTDIKSVLKAAHVIDIDQMMDSMLSAEANMINTLQDQYKVQPYLSNVLYNVTQAVQGVQEQVNGVVAMASYTPVHTQYVALKSEVCCWSGAELLSFWVYVTAAAVLGWMACVAGKAVLGRLDLLPRDNCLGLQCYRTKDYEELDDDDARKLHFLRRRQPPSLPVAGAPPNDLPPYMRMPPPIMGMGPGGGNDQPKSPIAGSLPQTAAVYVVPSGRDAASSSVDAANDITCAGMGLGFGITYVGSLEALTQAVNDITQSGEWRVRAGLVQPALPPADTNTITTAITADAGDRSWPPPTRQSAELCVDATALVPTYSHVPSSDSCSERASTDAAQEAISIAGDAQQGSSISIADNTVTAHNTVTADNTVTAGVQQDSGAGAGDGSGSSNEGLTAANSSSSAERQSSFWLMPPTV